MKTLTAGVAAAGLGVPPIAHAAQPYEIEEFRVTDPKLRDRVTVIHVSDIHFGPGLDASDLTKLVAVVNSLHGDLLVITGDIYHSRRSEVEEAVPVLRKLIPRPLGNYAVTGNHDYYAGIERAVFAITSTGIRLLRNEWLTIAAYGCLIHLGGLEDPHEVKTLSDPFPHFGPFMNRVPRTPGLILLLSHRPHILRLAAKAGVDLCLTGHMHGGQIIVFRAPGVKGFSWLELMSEYSYGWYFGKNCLLYLSKGWGVSHFPWRINCPPEIAVIHLEPGPCKTVRDLRADPGVPPGPPCLSRERGNDFGSHRNVSR